MTKILICVNTCNRANYVKAFAARYLRHCCENESYDFVLSLDGCDRDTVELCQKYKIPLLHSKNREGVGISKNRVLESFDNYDFYFFLDDDSELVDGGVFDKFIAISKKCNLHHMNLGEKHRFHGAENYEECVGERLLFANYGSGSLSFFTRHGINVVGGFHTEFSQNKRFGHTEHSYRFKHTSLSKQPFIVPIDCFDNYFIFHNPPSVTNRGEMVITENGLAIAEEKLIEQKLKHFPISTMSSYSFNGFCACDAYTEQLEVISAHQMDSLKRSK